MMNIHVVFSYHRSARRFALLANNVVQEISKTQNVAQRQLGWEHFWPISEWKWNLKSSTLFPMMMHERDDLEKHRTEKKFNTDTYQSNRTKS